MFDLLGEREDRSQIKIKSWRAYLGGAPANVACASVKLGTPAAFIGCTGSDEIGKESIRLLQEVGVNTVGIQLHPSAPTRQVYVLRSPRGDRSFAGFGETDPGEFADAYLQAAELPVELFRQAEFLVSGTLGLAYPHTRAAIFGAIALAREYGVKVLIDVNWRPMFWRDPSEAGPLIEQLWEYVDFLKLSDDEAQWLFKTTDSRKIASGFEKIEGVLVTAGDKEVNYCLRGKAGKVFPPSVRVVDTTGAGDSFVAGFLHQLCRQGISSLNLADRAREIVTYACAVGALTTTKLGAIAAQPTAREVEALLAPE